MAAVLSVWAAALTVLVWGAPAATAGGLTSVLVVSPESGETASLYYSDSAYRRLERLLGGAEGGPAAKPPEADLVGARQINVTWLAHDISPVRIDRIHLPPDTREAWIHSSTTPPEWTGTWHRPEQPGALRSLLAELGVTGEAVDPDTVAAGPPVPDTAAATPPEGARPTPTAPRAASAPDGPAWWWALSGLAVGLAAGYAGSLLIRHAATRREAGPPRGQPRQELIDR
ncbi:hypothetical protein [Streptomyces sp. enrichment culture]|uniref:hypothetical protein n=1 Tax=Streptomyces sp. enrichment culture TaxID=1795815 RepID=UPI003F5670D9